VTAVSVHVIGSSALTGLYALGLAAHEYRANAVDGVTASLAGLTQVRRQLTGRLAANAAH